MKREYWLSVILLAMSFPVFAHTGELSNSSLLHGFLHPLNGLDHLLVLAAVGLLAVKQGGRAVVLFPLAFMTLMASGAFIQRLDWQIPYPELLVALSVVLFGLLASFNKQQLATHFLAISSFFAVAHGYVHASEISGQEQALHFFSGLLLMSLLVCLISGLIGMNIGRKFNLGFSLSLISSGLIFMANI